MTKRAEVGSSTRLPRRSASTACSAGWSKKNSAARSALRIKTSLERASEALASHHEREVRPTLAAAVRSIGQGAPGIARALAPLRRLSGGPGAPTRRPLTPTLYP